MHGHFPGINFWSVFFPRCSREIGGRQTRLWQRDTIIGIFGAVTGDWGKEVWYNVLYLSVSKIGGEMYFEAIVRFNFATNVNLKIMEHNMKPQQQRIYGERIFICAPQMTTIFTIMMVSQLLVRNRRESIQEGLLHWINTLNISKSIKMNLPDIPLLASNN